MESARQRTSVQELGEEVARIQEAQHGSQKAFGEIVRAYQRAIYRVAWGLTRNASDADDLAQETFVRAWQAIGKFRVGEPIYPWLSRITVNLAYSLHRRRKRRPETPIEPLIEAGRTWDVDDDPADHAGRSERERHLEEAFGELSAEHQAVLLLRVVEDLSYEEIAKTLGVPPGTVMSRLSRARADLRTKMVRRTGESLETPDS